jgi:transcriptional regulator with XRE-family HTH domain
MNQMIDKDDLRIRRHLKTFIAERLQSLEMTEADLARATGDSKTQIGRVAKGQSTPSVAFASRIARALESTLDELCGVVETANS